MLSLFAQFGFCAIYSCNGARCNTWCCKHTLGLDGGPQWPTTGYTVVRTAKQTPPRELTALPLVAYHPFDFVYPFRYQRLLVHPNPSADAYGQ